MRLEKRTYIGTREEQQDHADIFSDERGTLAIVCDGMGSVENAELSAKEAVSEYIRLYRESDFKEYPAFGIKAIESIDCGLHEKYGKKCGTTFVSVYISENKLYWVSVGDSRLYIQRDGKLTQITCDHNYRYILDKRLENGLISEKEYEHEIVRGDALISYLGMGGVDTIDINVKPFILNEDDVLLLTTDGLVKLIDDKEISRVLTACAEDISAAADILIGAVKNANCSTDNTTFIMVKK